MKDVKNLKMSQHKKDKEDKDKEEQQKKQIKEENKQIEKMENSETKEKNKKNEKNEKNDGKRRMERPNNILIDIYGVITSWNFKNKLIAYVKDNVFKYLSEKSKDKTVNNIIDKLREQALIERSSGVQVPAIDEPTADQNAIAQSAAKNILWQMEHKSKSCQLQLDTLYNQMWADGYTSGNLKVHAFKDVKKSLEHWRFHQFVKIYSYASGAREGQRLFLSSTEEGDLTPFIANYINSSGGYKYDPNKFKVVLSALREANPNNLLYLTDDPKKAKAAIEVSMRAVVVLREGNPRYSEAELKNLITIKSLEEIVFEEDPEKPAPCC